jgi:hypothetical protein
MATAIKNPTETEVILIWIRGNHRIRIQPACEINISRQPETLAPKLPVLTQAF